MKIPPLQKGVLLQRYKRFLADIRLDSGETITAHCPNSGSMLTCKEPGSVVMVSKSDNPKRKYAHTWEMIHCNNNWVGINTLVPNRLVYEAIKEQKIPELVEYTSIRKEVPCGTNSRIDLLLKTERGRARFVEIKSVTLARDHIAYFPDSVTTRGTKHLNDLMDIVKAGDSSTIFFLVQRQDTTVFQPEKNIDPVYAQTLKQAEQAGVDILVYQADVTPAEITISRRLPYIL